MRKEDSMYQKYINILKTELVPAMGCTEPIAIAYAAALAQKTLQEDVKHVEIYASGNIIKNVKSVTVPNTNGRKGILGQNRGYSKNGKISGYCRYAASSYPEWLCFGTYCKGI